MIEKITGRLHRPSVQVEEFFQRHFHDLGQANLRVFKQKHSIPMEFLSFVLKNVQLCTYK